MISLNEQSIKQIPDNIGVYRIFACDENDKPICINRFAKADESGLVYIGRTIKQNLRLRVNNFFYSSLEGGKTKNHSGAIKYKTRNIIKKRLGDHKLKVEYYPCNNPKEEESKALNKYAQEFGEFPLLNK